MSIRLPLNGQLTKEQQVCECPCHACSGCTNQATPGMIFARRQLDRFLKSLRRTD